MKKIIAILLALVTLVGLTACAGASDGVTYAIICKDASNPYMQKMIEGFETACKDLGINFLTKSPETT